MFSGILILAVLLVPSWLLKLCGVSLTKYPELNPHMYAYLNGYAFGIPAMLLVQVFGPILVMDNGKKLFSVSSTVLCVGNILGDLLNAFLFHGGAFGMGLATSCSYLLQLLVLMTHFIRAEHFFHLSPRLIRFEHLADIARGGSPSLVKRLSGTLRDILINHFNMITALTTAAIAAKGIQSDLFQFLFCISSGLGQTLVTMSGMYYGANDLQGLKRLYSYAMKFGIQITAVTAAVVFAAAGPLSRLYSSDSEVVALAVFSIRWMSLGLVFDTFMALLQHYLQGTKNLKILNALCLSERFFVPVVTALTLGKLFGSRGILASTGISKIILVLILFLYVCIRTRRLPKRWEDLMFLPENFGGTKTDNLYGCIRTREDAVRESERSYEFCLAHGADRAKAFYLALCVEETAINIIDHADKSGREDVRADFRLYLSDGRICFILRDLSDQFDPTAYDSLHVADSPEEHIGIRMVTVMATEMRYFSAFNSNNLVIYLD